MDIGARSRDSLAAPILFLQKLSTTFKPYFQFRLFIYNISLSLSRIETPPFRFFLSLSPRSSPSFLSLRVCSLSDFLALSRVFVSLPRIHSPARGSLRGKISRDLGVRWSMAVVVKDLGPKLLWMAMAASRNPSQVCLHIALLLTLANTFFFYSITYRQ